MTILHAQEAEKKYAEGKFHVQDNGPLPLPILWDPPTQKASSSTTSSTAFSSTEGKLFPRLMVFPSPVAVGTPPHQAAMIIHDWACLAFLPYVLFTFSFRVKSLFHFCSFNFQLVNGLHFS